MAANPYTRSLHSALCVLKPGSVWGEQTMKTGCFTNTMSSSFSFETALVCELLRCRKLVGSSAALSVYV